MRVVLAAIAIIGVVGLTAVGSATGVAGEALPDVVADAPTNPQLQTYVVGGSQRLLLRFDGYVHNQGAGPLEILAKNPTATNPTMTAVSQRIYDANGAFVREDTSRRPTVLFETADGHNHWHLRSAMRYALYNASKTAEVAPSQKVGFCLEDSQRMDGFGPGNRVYSQASFCERNNPVAPQVTMGISSGWRDNYSASLWFQWVDVSDVQPGSYWLAASSDPDSVVVESNEGNNGAVFAASPSVIPGYVAQPVTASGIVAGQPRQVTLDARVFGSGLAAPKYRIISSPAGGTLDQAVNQPFEGPVVTYTPTAAFAGSDAFTYVAYDPTSGYPRTQAAAVVTLTGSTVVQTVSISGAPASMIAGTSVDLTATVTPSPLTVEWRVNGILGGTSQAGTVTPGGRYTAPATPPPGGGTITIRASTTNASSEVVIRIDPVSAPEPAPAPPPSTPTPAPTPAPAPDTGLAATPAPTPAPEQLTTVAPLLPPTVVPRKLLPILATPTLARRGNVLVIGALSRRAGTVEVSAWKGASRIGRCIARTPASRSLTCQIRLGSGFKVAGVRVAVHLLVGGKAVALRRATFSRQIAGHRTLALCRGTGLQCWLSEPPR